jgi:hypothetical protein
MNNVHQLIQRYMKLPSAVVYIRKVELTLVKGKLVFNSRDSGGPMFANDHGKIVLVGITSYGNGCAYKKYPGVYARVASYSVRSFIEENM